MHGMNGANPLRPFEGAIYNIDTRLKAYRFGHTDTIAFRWSDRDRDHGKALFPYTGDSIG